MHHASTRTPTLALAAPLRAGGLGRARARGLAGLVVAVLLTHAALLWGLPWSPLNPPARRPGQPQAAPVITVLSLGQAHSPDTPPPAPAQPAPVTDPGATGSAHPQATGSDRPRPRPAAEAPVATLRLSKAEMESGGVEAMPQPAEPQAPTPLPAPSPYNESAELAEAAASAQATPAQVAGAQGRHLVPLSVVQPASFPPPPVYAVDYARSAELRFRVVRGPLEGMGTLRWNITPEGYLVAWRDETPGRPPIDWVSTGETDAAGLAPERMVEMRRGRPLHAVNFQRDKAIISFAGPPTTSPLHPGAQDRATWLVQLIAVARAGGLALTPGGSASFQVAGPRGDVELWTFRYIDKVPVYLGVGPPVAAVELLREPQRPYDWRVRVWLALDHGLLPVRIRMETVPGSEPMDWLLTAGLPGR